MTETARTLTISWGAVTCRLEGFGAAHHAMHALGAFLCEQAATQPSDDAPLPLPDPDRLVRLVGPEIASRIAVHVEGDRIEIRLHDAPLRARPEAPGPLEPEASGPEDLAARAAARGIRVVKVPRADMTAAREAGVLGSTSGSADAGVPADGVLCAEDEAELRRELDRIDIELGRVPATRKAHRPVPDSREAEISRIFDRTDSRMSEAAVRQRSSAHRHLRAALAASRAEQDAPRARTTDAHETIWHGDVPAARGGDGGLPLFLAPSQRVESTKAGTAADGKGRKDPE